jgi:hypothetical protein
VAVGNLLQLCEFLAQTDDFFHHQVEVLEAAAVIGDGYAQAISSI